MKRTGQRGSGRPPIHCDINVEIILSDKDQVIIIFLKFKDTLLWLLFLFNCIMSVYLNKIYRISQFTIVL